jgi:hypothetical protein
MPPAASKVIQTNNKEVHEELVSITEKIDLTKKQHEVLNYMQYIRNLFVRIHTASSSRSNAI